MELGKDLKERYLLQGLDVLYIGDSILEALRGSNVGDADPVRYPWVYHDPQVFHNCFTKFVPKTDVFAIGGKFLSFLICWSNSFGCFQPWLDLKRACWWTEDTTFQVQYRITNGELSRSMKLKAVVLLIGTNDVGNIVGVSCQAYWSTDMSSKLNLSTAGKPGVI